MKSMINYKWGVIFLLIFTMGCATTDTTLEDPNGRIWKITSRNNALVELEKDGIKIKVDNRGKLGVIESVFGVLMLKTDIELSNKNRGD